MSKKLVRKAIDMIKTMAEEEEDDDDDEYDEMKITRKQPKVNQMRTKKVMMRKKPTKRKMKMRMKIINMHNSGNISERALSLV